MRQEQEREEWANIPRYFGLYEASDRGRIKNTKTGRVLVGVPCSVGRRYRGVTLFHPDLATGHRFEYVHRLVLEAHVGRCPSGKECAHVDADPANNHVENLAWISHKANMVLRDIDGNSKQHKGSWAL